MEKTLNEAERRAICREVASGRHKGAACFSARYIAFVNEAIRPSNRLNDTSEAHDKFLACYADVAAAGDSINAKAQVSHALCRHCSQTHAAIIISVRP